MFKLKEHGTDRLTEINAGLTTFLSMAYIMAVNPAILSASGMPRDALFTATVLGTVVATLLMVFIANLPFALAPAMGINAFFVVAVTVMGYTWQQALTAVFFAGILFVLLAISPARDKMVREIPKPLQYAICAGVGIMIASIGLTNSGVVVSNRGFPGIGNLSQGAPLLAVIGIFVTAALLALKLRFALLAGIFITTLIGIPLGVTKISVLNTGIFSIPPSLAPIALQFDFSILGSLDFWGLVISFLFMAVVGSFAGFLSLFSIMNSEVERYHHKMGPAFIADSLSVIAGSAMGLSPNTVYGESGSGVAAGGRTGLTALVVAAGFLVALFAAPLFLVIPFAAVAPALIVVGWLMLIPVTRVDFNDATEAFPAIVVLVLIALTWRLSDSMTLAWIAYVIMKVVSGRQRELTATVWVIGLIFALKMIL